MEQFKEVICILGLIFWIVALSWYSFYFIRNSLMRDKRLEHKEGPSRGIGRILQELPRALLVLSLFLLLITSLVVLGSTCVAIIGLCVLSPFVFTQDFFNLLF